MKRTRSALLLRRRRTHKLATLTGLLCLSLTMPAFIGTPASAAPAAHPHSVGAAKPVKTKNWPKTDAPKPDPKLAADVAHTKSLLSKYAKLPAGGHAVVTIPPTGLSPEISTIPIQVGVATAHTVSPKSSQRNATSVPSAARQAELTIADARNAEAAGITGIVFAVQTVGTTTTPTPTDVSLDYSTFRYAYGGDWASRLELVQLPACALTTPAKPDCQTRTPVAFTNRLKTGAITTTATIGATPTVIAATAGAQSGSGDFTATSLSASSSWQAGGNSGDFTWNYPLRVPPANGGPAPDLAITYDSQSIDGRLPANNNQASNVGDGFDLTSSYIERSYGSCKDDGQAGKQDECWKYDNATLVLNGQSTQLVKDDTTGLWRPKDDDGSLITHSTTGSSTLNGDNDGETWTVTTLDGTKYVFGMNHLPGYTSDAATPPTNSVWTVPVFGDDPGEPCHASTFATSACNQAWRWNLDYVVDPNGNTETYWYQPEYNYYAENADTTVNGARYTRGGYLTRIDYGQTSANIYTTPAPEQVVFKDDLERCVPAGTETCAALNSTNKADWPDVPFDEICAANVHCTASQTSPTFFTTKRLTNITTQYWTVSGATYQPVDSWDLTQEFAASGDSTAAAMILDSITHTGKVGTAISLNPVTFDYIQLTNRVDSSDDTFDPIVRRRVQKITSETGSQTIVSYMDPECVSGSTPQPDSNTKRCFPSYWTEPGSSTPRLDWFQKYPVASIQQTDPTGGGDSVETDYAYDGAAWHYDDNNFITPDKNKTWSIWRGYRSVVTTTGAPTDTRTQSKTLYFQGMNGDKIAAGGTKTVNITDSQGTQVTDSEQLAGQIRETITYNGVGGSEVSGAITDKLIVQTASQTIAPAGSPTRTAVADIVRDAATHARTDLTAGGARKQTITTTYSTTATGGQPATGLPTTVDDTGDQSISGDEQCTRTTYAQDTTTWLMNFPDRVESVAVSCSSTPNRPADVVSDNRVEYDGTAFGAAPTKGNATTLERLLSYSGSTPTYQTVSTVGYDSQGRTTSVADALSHAVTTAYTPATGGPVTQTVTTNALSQQTTTTVNPAWGSTSIVVDANSKKTEAAYDALGRVTSVWLPNRNRSAIPAQLPNTTYTYTLSNTAPSTIVTQGLNSNGTTYLTSSISFYDAMLRPRQTQTPNSIAGERVISQTDYNSLGQAYESDSDAFDANPPSTTMANVTDTWPRRAVTTYDGIGRDIVDTLYGLTTIKQTVQTSYLGNGTTVTAPDGAPASTMLRDVRGNIIEHDVFSNPTPTGPFQATHFTYTPANQLKTVADAAGNTWTYSYDLQGRPTDAYDPDAGHTHTDYDAADRVTDTIDALNHEIQYDYDVLNRKTAQYEGTDGFTKSNANEAAAWLYDTLQKGQLTSSTRYIGGTSGVAYIDAVTTYDPLYRATASKITIPAYNSTTGNGEQTGIAGTYNFFTDYNLDGTVQDTALPAGGGLSLEDLAYSYNTVREPIKLVGATGIVSSETYTEIGQPQMLTLSSATGKQVQITNSYEAGTERLHNTFATYTASSAEPLDATYSYDAAGNTTEIKDAGSGANDDQCFTYDGQARLAQAWTTTTNCDTGPSTALLGGPAPYWQSWTYDTNTGLRTSQTNHDTSGTSTVSDYTYSPRSSGGPHAVQTITNNGIGGVGTGNFAYNADGQTISRPGPTAQETLSWDTEGHLSQITQGTNTTNNIYDADGNLLVSRGPAETVLYLPGEQVHRTTSGTLSGQREIQFNGQTIAVRTNTGLTWLLSDPHGTSTVAIDAATQAVTHRYETPFNTPRGTPPSAWPSSNGFLDKPSDTQTGITYIGARQYDPTTGTFLSVDPMLSPINPETFDAYTYAGDNPIALSDPSGMVMCDCGPDGEVGPAPQIVGGDDTGGGESSGEAGEGKTSDDGSRPQDHGNSGKGKPAHGNGWANQEQKAALKQDQEVQMLNEGMDPELADKIAQNEEDYHATPTHQTDLNEEQELKTMKPAPDDPPEPTKPGKPSSSSGKSPQPQGKSSSSANPKSSSVQTVADENGGVNESYPDMKSLNAAHGDPTGETVLGHIVEQSQLGPFPEGSGFTAEQIYSTDNVVRISPQMNSEMNRQFAAPRPGDFWGGGMRNNLRMSGASWDDQYEIGLRMMERLFEQGWS